MSEEFIIERKLLLDGEGSGEDQRLNVFVKQLAIWAKSSKSPTECEAGYNSMLAQLNRLELYKKRMNLRMRCYKRQLKTYRAMHDNYRAKKELVLKDIEKQEKFLGEAKIIKKYRIDRNLIVKTVNEGQSCRQLTEEVHNLKKDISNLEDEKEHLQSQLKNRVQQFRLLSVTANILKMSLQNNSSL
ncbi:unnamed protein product [Ceutorhynchus assimilis]|uniref:Uncharacterized protein n=1 Tax=Ceutorhynchus assimilis TaxID=467358 RepID=A0A9P0GS11_9CUCU|nr:unnamed protein product [Ceutorhynchus assimilis]